jgi:hypothetical protein
MIDCLAHAVTTCASGLILATHASKVEEVESGIQDTRNYDRQLGAHLRYCSGVHAYLFGPVQAGTSTATSFYLLSSLSSFPCYI